jgi:hypothetical protein
LPKDDLEQDGLIDEDGNVREGQLASVDRLGEGTYVVRVRGEDGLPDVRDCEEIRRIAAEIALDLD